MILSRICKMPKQDTFGVWTHGSVVRREKTRVKCVMVSPVWKWQNKTHSDFDPMGEGSVEKKKGLLLFDYACHPCTGTMLIFSVYLSVCLMSRPEGRTMKMPNSNVYKQYLLRNASLPSSLITLSSTLHPTVKRLPYVFHARLKCNWLVPASIMLLKNEHTNWNMSSFFDKKRRTNQNFPLQ